MNGGDIGITNPILGNNLQMFNGGQFIAAILKTFINLVFIVGTTIFVFMFLYGAIKWILSGGDKGQLESARGTITHALIGLILLVATFAIIKLIEAILGIEILHLDLTKLYILQKKA